MSTKKIALVTGIAGQDGSYLASSDIGYQGAISFDASKPDGSPRKWMDSGRLNALGWQAKVELQTGLLWPMKHDF
jgi:GDP-D-mannose dehydratase